MLFGLISPVYAQSATGTSSAMINFLPIILIFAVMYFMMIRPQQKKMREHKNMIDNLRRGDRVIASGGLIGTISKIIDENEVEITVGSAELRVLRSSINQILNKSIGGNASATEDKKAKMKVVTNLKKK